MIRTDFTEEVRHTYALSDHAVIARAMRRADSEQIVGRAVHEAFDQMLGTAGKAARKFVA
jgi:hypothetical protein